MTNGHIWLFIICSTPSTACPAQQMEATWITVQSTSVTDYPTAVADGLATALFVADPNELNNTFAFDCATLDADRHATISAGFPGRFF